MGVGAEARAAVGALTPLGRALPAAAREAEMGAFAWYPAVGLALGGGAALVAAGVRAVVPAAAGPAGVLALEALAGFRPRLDLAAAAGVLAAGAALVVKLAAAAALPRAACTAALLLAPMLGRWAIVVQGYGGAPAGAGARFREFGVASVLAFGVALAAGQAVGLVLLVVAALLTVGLRVAAHRRPGGLAAALPSATGEVIETAVLLTLAVL